MSFLQRLYVQPLNAQWVHSERKVNASKQNFVSASEQWANTEPKRECKAKFNGDRTHDKQYVKEDEQFIRIAFRTILTLFFVSNQEKIKNKLHVCIVMSLNMISHWVCTVNALWKLRANGAKQRTEVKARWMHHEWTEKWESRTLQELSVVNICLLTTFSHLWIYHVYCNKSFRLIKSCFLLIMK